tara:strand:+ start:122169 stop:122474 length:306 start_codon:yes stop_codon:yes gene_type:complete
MTRRYIAYGNYTHEKALNELSDLLTNRLPNDAIEEVCQRLHLTATDDREANIHSIINELDDAMLDAVISVLDHVNNTYVIDLMLDEKPVKKSKGLFSKKKA